MNQDLWLRAITLHGSSLLQEMLGDKNAIDVLGKQNNLRQLVSEKPDGLFKECDLPLIPDKLVVPPVPLEFFRNCSKLERRNIFFKSLNRGDVLTLKIVNVLLEDEYKLLVLKKHQCSMKLDDLSLVMYLGKAGPVREIETELSLGNIVQAAVCACDINERKMYVTLDNNFLEDNQLEKVVLGKVSDYVPPPSIDESHASSNYVTYLNGSLDSLFWENKLVDSLQLDKKRCYSFLDDWDGKQYPTAQYGSQLKKKQCSKMSETFYTDALKCYASSDPKRALSLVNSALSAWPDNIDALVLRATLYHCMNNIQKAFADLTSAMAIDKDYDPVKKKMAAFLLDVSKTHVESKDLKKAEECLEAARKFDEANANVDQALQALKGAVITVSSSSSSDESQVSKASSSKSRKKKSKKHKSHKSKHGHHRSRRSKSSSHSRP